MEQLFLYCVIFFKAFSRKNTLFIVRFMYILWTPTGMWHVLLNKSCQSVNQVYIETITVIRKLAF